MQKHVNLVDLVKSFPTNILLQNLTSIQKRTSPVKFAHMAEKSGKGSISNLSTKVPRHPVPWRARQSFDGEQGDHLRSGAELRGARAVAKVEKKPRRNFYSFPQFFVVVFPQTTLSYTSSITCSAVTLTWESLAKNPS